MTFPFYLTDKSIANFIAAALAEDIGEGDHSTLGVVSPTLDSRARLIIKDDGVLAGVALAEKIFKQYDARLSVQVFKNDGDEVRKGEIAFVVEGPGQAILSTERVVLNCMQRMSGIATYTRYLCGLLKGTKTQLLDTRKTTPNFRLMEKWAVAIGGGTNHRFALYDMVILKDNHVDMAGGISEAITRINNYLSAIKKTLKIEIETRTVAEVEAVMQTGGVDVIMLDNMTIEDMQTAVRIISGKYKTEASGGISEATLRQVAACGVDFISVGALTHSVKSLDLSLKVT
jgi:nicotinate-nucleotide pyrophosphorylase (carboxylating)